MNEEQLKAIEERFATAQRAPISRRAEAHMAAYADIPALIAEVRRLQVALEAAERRADALYYGMKDE